MAIRVGLYGGTFDPIHVGHLIAARAARERLGLDRLIVIPSAHPPHKPVADLTDASHRVAMAKLAVEGESDFEVSDCEVRRTGPSYTIDTVGEFRRRFGPEADLIWLIGADTLGELAGWHRLEDLVEACRIVTLARPGWESPDVEPLRSRLSAAQIDRLCNDRIDTPRIDVSATDIRRRLAEGKSVRWFVPEAVRQYIVGEGLYAADPNDL